MSSPSLELFRERSDRTWQEWSRSNSTNGFGDLSYPFQPLCSTVWLERIRKKRDLQNMSETAISPERRVSEQMGRVGFVWVIFCHGLLNCWEVADFRGSAKYACDGWKRDIKDYSFNSLSDVDSLIFSQNLISRFSYSSKGTQTLKTRAENGASHKESFWLFSQLFPKKTDLTFVTHVPE